MMWAQIVGGLAFLVGVLAFLQKDDIKFRYYLVAFCVVIGIHFAMMGAIAGAVGVLINGLRTYVTIHRRTPVIMYTFMILLFAMTLPYMEHPIELLAILGSTVGTWALFKTQGIKMRALVLFNSVCWFTHNLWIGSIGGSLIEGTFIITNILTIYRLYKDTQKEVSPA